MDLIRELYRPMLTLPNDPASTVEHRLVTGPRGGGGRLYRDGRLVASQLRPASALGQLVRAINRQVISGASKRLLLHAAAAADGAGRVVLLPASTEAGKTTLVAGLLQRGMSYLSDEAAAVDDELTVRGFPKPLSIDSGSWQILKDQEPSLSHHLAPYMAVQWQVAPQDIAPVLTSARLAAIVFPQYRPRALTSTTRLAPVSALDAARACTFGDEGRPLPADRVRQLAQIVASVPAYRLCSGDLDEACAAVMHVLSTRPPDSTVRASPGD